MEFFLHGVAAVFFLPAAWYLSRLARRMPATTNQPLPGLPDAIAASALGLWFILLIAQSQGSEPTVNTSTILGSAVVYATLLSLIFLFLRVRGVSVLDFFCLRSMPSPAVLRTSIGALAASLPLIYVAQWSASLALGQQETRQPLLDFWLQGAGLGGRLMVILMAVAIAPIAEEILFRGYLFRVAEHFAGRWPAIATVSLLFAGVHVHLPAFGGLFLLAVALNILYCVTGSLWAPIIAHAVFNSLTLLLSLVWPETF